MARMLVTGGCGFIGSNFIRQLLAADPSVHITNYDYLTYAGNINNLADVTGHPRYSFIHGDITDRSFVRRVIKNGIDTIVHFAAESHVDRSIYDARPFIHSNVLGTQTLLDAAREFNVERFVHVSTDEVYGSLGKSGYFSEESPLAPNSPYAASKAAADMLVRSYVQTYGLPAVITRCSNNYGPFQFPEKLIPLFITSLLRDEQVPVYGDGLNVRDWIHVQDHCRAIDAVRRLGRIGEVYNIGGRCELTNLELTHLLLELMGKPTSLIRYVADRPGHDRRYAIDCSKIRRELGWQAEVNFTDGLRETVRWYCANQDWVQKALYGTSLKIDPIISQLPLAGAA